MGNPLAAMVVIPIAMVLAEQNGRDPVIMGLGAINGSVAGCFAPTSLYGILTVSIGKEGGVDLNPYAQFAFVLAIVVALQFAAQFIFRQHAPTNDVRSPDDGLGSAPTDSSDGAPGLPGSESGVAVATRAVTRDTGSEAAPTAATPVQRVTILALILLIVFVVGMPIFGLGINIGPSRWHWR